MNIFVLDLNPKIAAQMLCNKHVVKMALETAQMLCSIRTDAPYKRAYYNHPCTVWSRATEQNYRWLLEHGKAICAEYTERYLKRHKSLDAILWCEEHIRSAEFMECHMERPLCMPDHCKIVGDVVQSYRNYYKMEKSKFAQWPEGKIPYWWN